MLNNLPNFLIVGAGKCGTTSLYYYLKQHPEIYMGPVKEPHFLICNSLEFPHRGVGDGFFDTSLIVKDFREYKRLFSGIKNETRIGEASTGYLYYYETAIPQIKRILGGVRIIMVLRNPIDRAYSAYLHASRDGRESLSFEDGLRQEEKRIKSNWIPLWHYTSCGFYYKQVQAYLENFSQVKVCLFDDLKEDTMGLLKDVYNFLDVDSTFVPNNLGKVYNVSGIPKYRIIHDLFTKPNPVKFMSKMILRVLVGEERKIAIGENIKGYFLRKPKMRAETRKYLIQIYREDILVLQDLINRDLSHWLK